MLVRRVHLCWLEGYINVGYRGVVRSQTNVAEHDPEYCQDKFEQWGSPSEQKCPIPQFAGNSPAVRK